MKALTLIPVLRCGFCFDREQGTYGEIKREWSPEWLMYISVCRKHALADGMIDGMIDGKPHPFYGSNVGSDSSL